MQENNSPVYPSAAIAWTTVGILSLTYMFSFLDRQILVLLIDPIKADLNITDTGVSLLTGFAFAIVYTVMGIPMGRLADLWIRKYVIIIGVTIWSLLTVSCGFARNFTQLFLARMGVGVGEAALTPTAYAMIADLFPPNKLARAMSIFVLGSAAGNAASLLAGGFVIGFAQDIGTLSIPVFGEIRPWQLVLIVVGIASLLMVIPLSLTPEPKRHGKIKQIDSSDPDHMSFREVLHYMWSHKTFYGPYIGGICLLALFMYGGLAWIPTYFIRIQGWDAAETGMRLGIIYLVPSIVGGLFAGWLTDHFFNKGHRGAPLYIMITIAIILVPLVPFFIYVPVMSAKMVGLVSFYFCISMIAILFPTIIQMATPNQIRSQVSAIILFAINLVGIGFGPTSIALVTDYGFHDDLAIGHSIAIVGATVYGIGAVILFYAVKPFIRQSTTIAEG